MENIYPLDEVRMRLYNYYYNAKMLDFLRYFVRNWQDAVFFVLGLRRSAYLQLKSGEGIEIKKIEDLRRLFEGREYGLALFGYLDERNPEYGMRLGNNTVSFSSMGRRLTFFYDSPLRLVQVLYAIRDNFINADNSMDVKNKVVVDVGANLADTAIYFVLCGAKKVYTFEPDAEAYRSGMKNIRMNKLTGKISFSNKFVTLQKSDAKHTSLREIADTIKGSAVLKVDCEGCEYELMDSPTSTLRRFDSIIIEYHHGYRNLKERLESVGFRVRAECPRQFALSRKIVFGMLRAKRW